MFRFNKSVFVFLICIFSISNSFAQDAPKVKAKVGGLLRFTYNNSSWKDAQQKRGGDFAYDVFGIISNVTYGKLFLDAEFRLYSDAFGGPMLKRGYVGYNFDDSSVLRVGLTNVPFGNYLYNSHSFFFSMDYYTGTEDDYDMGVSYTKKFGKFLADIAFFKNAEEFSMADKGDVEYGRYAPDVASVVDENGTLAYRNKEANQVNLRGVFFLGENEFKQQIGGSVEYGQLFNLDTEDMGSHSAFAVHYNADYKRWNFKAQVSYFNYDAANPDSENDDVIGMGMFGGGYFMASEGANYTASVAYKLPIKSDWINSLTFYNDFGLLDKLSNDDFNNSIMNVTGVLFHAGPIYTYFDVAYAKGNNFLGPNWTNAFASGDEDWNYRINVNIGFYF